MKRTANRNLEQAAKLYHQVLLNSNFPEQFVKAATALLAYRGWVDFVEMEREMTVFDAEPSQTGVQVGWDFFVEAESFLTYTLNLLKMPRFDLGSAEREILALVEGEIAQAIDNDPKFREPRTWMGILSQSDLKERLDELFPGKPPKMEVQKVISVGASMEGGSGSRGTVQASLYLAPLA